LVRHDANLLALDDRRGYKPSFRWTDPEVDGQTALGAGEGDDDAEFVVRQIELVVGDDEDGAAFSLLMADGRV